MESPLWAIAEKIYVLYFVSLLFAIICGIIALVFGVKPTHVIIFSVILALIPPGFYDLYRRNRISSLEAEFPAFLRDLTLSIKSGMTVRGAISIAAGGDYGALTEAVRHIDYLMSWGIPLDEALLYFNKRYPTPLIRRTVSTITEASSTGGEMGPILESVATDAQETKALQRRRSSETKPYLAVCYLSYFVFLAVILVLSLQFLPMMEGATDAAQGGTGLGAAGGSVSKEDVELYGRLFFHALLLQGFFAGVVTGKIGEGTVFAGLKHSVLFIMVAVIAYTLFL